MTRSIEPFKAVLSPANSDKKQKAQWCVGAAMGACLGCWFLPVVSGVACSLIEAKLIHQLLRVLDCHSDESAEKIYWFFRQKTFFLFGATYLPIAGVPLQVFETYGLGQFALHCALKPKNLLDEAWLEESWTEVAPRIFSGEHAVKFYEQFSGKPFPTEARQKFIGTVDMANRAYQISQRIPGGVKTQKILGKGLYHGTKLGGAALRGVGNLAKSGIASFNERGIAKRKALDEVQRVKVQQVVDQMFEKSRRKPL